MKKVKIDLHILGLILCAFAFSLCMYLLITANLCE
jgi:hypothetical protein